MNCICLLIKTSKPFRQNVETFWIKRRNLLGRSHGNLIEFIFNKALYASTPIDYSAVIERSVTTKQSVQEHDYWIASPQAVRNDVSIN
jgi:hypothetical protein